MLRNILLINSIFFFLFLTSCEEFYNFEANKLNEENKVIIDKSQIETDPSKKLVMYNKILNNYKKIQKKYKKTKIAKIHRKEKVKQFAELNNQVHENDQQLVFSMHRQ